MAALIFSPFHIFNFGNVGFSRQVAEVILKISTFLFLFSFPRMMGHKRHRKYAFKLFRIVKYPKRTCPNPAIPYCLNLSQMKQKDGFEHQKQKHCPHSSHSCSKNIRFLDSKPLDFRYDNTCPLLYQQHFGKGVNPEEAHGFYFNSGAPKAMQRGIHKISIEEQQNIVCCR